MTIIKLQILYSLISFSEKNIKSMNYVHVVECGKSVCFLWVPNNTERRKKIEKKLSVISNLQSSCVAFKMLISPYSVIIINILFCFSPLIIVHDHRLALQEF